MTYTRHNWTNGPATTSRLSASFFNNIEDGVEEATDAVRGRLSEANLEGTIVSGGATVGLMGGAERRRAQPERFARVGTSPIITAADSDLGSVYWPWVIKVTDLIDSPIAAYYMWTSTDHDANDGGIELWTSPQLAGPWTSQGLVYVDNVQPVTDGQTETPSVVWVEETSKFYMYYQQKGVGVGQSTLLATSPDGETWTRIGKAVDVNAAADQPGDGHTGYFTPFRIGKRWYGYSLKGSGIYPHFGLWYSNDGIVWNADPRALGFGMEWSVQTGGRRIEWNHSNVFMWRGRLWWLGVLSNFTAGATPKDARIAIAPLSEDLRRLEAAPEIIWTPDEAWESDNVRAVSVHVDEGNVYVYYQCDDSIGLAVVGGI